jgi:secondary thiamine-phosphate synthase enzyme
MRQKQAMLRLPPAAAGLHDITGKVVHVVSESHIATGLLTVFIRHTSASLLIQENADPDVLRDLEDYFAKIVPRDGSYRHDAEGPDDMPSHIKAALTATTLSVPIREGRLALGIWQGIYLFEHRDAPHSREVVLHLLGE